MTSEEYKLIEKMANQANQAYENCIGCEHIGCHECYNREQIERYWQFVDKLGKEDPNVND